MYDGDKEGLKSLFERSLMMQLHWGIVKGGRTSERLNVRFMERAGQVVLDAIQVKFEGRLLVGHGIPRAVRGKSTSGLRIASLLSLTLLSLSLQNGRYPNDVS